MTRTSLLDGVEHVVWDWNGTLLDDCDYSVTVVNAMLRDGGLREIDGDGYREHFDFPVRAYYEKLGFEVHDASWEMLARQFIETYQRGVVECRLHSGVVPVLEALGNRRLTSSILSVAQTRFIEPMLARHGIARFFTTVVGLSNHYAVGKVELGKDWLNASGKDPRTVLLVGDTVHDHEVATALGVRSVLLTLGHQSRGRLMKCGVPVIDRLEDLLD
ncbi:MAG TPA: HAD hydrolase-like protein [Polyangiaceae bacterium]|jgi:phosphoglycolate phosphatase|nr:HAD hydrolase-like protein [Polyangiaceae bacterium]